MAINYGAYRKRAFKQGQRMGFYEANRKRREAMSARMQQLAEDTGAAERAQAQAQFQTDQKARIKENEEVQSLKSAQAFKLRDDDKLEYSEAYFDKEARDRVKKSGVPHKTKAEFDADVDATMVQIKSKHGQFYNRTYKSDARANADLRKLQTASRLKQTTNSSKEQYTAFDSLLSLGFNKTEAQDTTPVAPMASGLVPESEKDLSRLPEALPVVGDPITAEREGKLEDFQTVEKLDSDGNVIVGRTFRMATDERTGQAYVLGTDGQWETMKGDYQIVDKRKTGVGKAAFIKFNSPLQEKSFATKSSREGRSVNSLDALYNTVASKMANPKDFADRMFEALGNTLAAVAGFDGTEGEIVSQYLNATSEEERAVIKKSMGYGVSDAVHAGAAKQRELFATLHLARALAGTGKLSVNAMESSRAVTEGGSGTKSLSTLGNASRAMRETLQRSVISQAGRHNIQLGIMKPGGDKDRVERTMGYPVFSSTQYRKQMASLGSAADPIIIKALDDAFKAKKIFFKDEFGRTMAPAIIKYTTEQGTEAYTISHLPQHFE